MTSPEKCPFCGSTKVVPAEFVVTGDGLVQLHFPQVTPFPFWKLATAEDDFRDVHVDSPTTACLGCGTLWAKYDLPKALRMVTQYGSPEIQAMLPAVDDGTKPQS